MLVFVRSPLSQHNFVKYGPIVTTLDIEVVVYDACFAKNYHGNKATVKVTEIVKPHDVFLTL